MIVSLTKFETGVPEQVQVPFAGQRFMHTDTPEMEVTQRFMNYDGWILLERLVDIILFFRPLLVVEIGCGDSTKVLAKATENAGVMFYSCDKAPRKNVTYHDKHVHHQMMSEDFMEVFDDMPSIVLIDGDHSYAMAKKEFDFFFEKLVPNGVIFIHDTFPPHEEYLGHTGCHDVYKLRQELEQRTDEMDVFTWPWTAKYMGLTMVMKKDPERPFWGK